RADVRLPLPGELRLPLLGHFDTGFLATMAHHALRLVPRLCVHPAWRESFRRVENGPQSMDRLPSCWCLARRKLEFHRLGALAWVVPVAGAPALRRYVARPYTAAAAHRVRPACHPDQLGVLPRADSGRGIALPRPHVRAQRTERSPLE